MFFEHFTTKSLRRNLMKIVIGIPTANRAHDLRNTLKSIFENIELPDAIIVVDQSKGDETRKVVNEFINKNKEIEIRYIHADKKSLTHARNIILDEVNEKYDIVLFLDDDIVLDKNYILEVKKFYSKYKDVVGMTGKIINTSNWAIIKNSIRALLRGQFEIFIGMFLPPRLTSFLTPTVPIILFFPEHPIATQWLSGCNMSYRISQIKGERFEEQFILYSYGEDVIFSYGLYMKGKKLAMNPLAKLKHLESQRARLPSKAKTLMMLGYRLYALAKFRKPQEVEKLFKKYVKYIKPLRKTSKTGFNRLLEIIESEKSNIIAGDLEGLNEKILELLDFE